MDPPCLSSIWLLTSISSIEDIETLRRTPWHCSPPYDCLAADLVLLELNKQNVLSRAIMLVVNMTFNCWQNFIKSHTASPQNTDTWPIHLNKQSKINYIHQPSSCPRYDCQSSLNTKHRWRNFTNKSRHACPHCNSQLLTQFQINSQSNKTRTIEVRTPWLSKWLTAQYTFQLLVDWPKRQRQDKRVVYLTA